MTDTSPKRDTPAPTGSSPWWRARWVVPVVLLVLAVIFVLENRAPVTIRLLIPVVVMPQWAALTIALVIGLLIGLTIRRRRRR